MQLDFLNSNWHRQYPFRDLHGVVDLNGLVMSSDIVVNVRITTMISDGDVYIDKVFTNDGYVSVSFCSAAGLLGYASGWIDDDNGTLTIRDYSAAVIGSVTIGNKDSTIKRQVYRFDNTNGLLEPTCVFIAEPPLLSCIEIKGVKLVGNIVINSGTVTITKHNNTIRFDVKNTDTIQSRKDKRAKNLTCDNPVISAINDVKPSDTGNIDIYAIEPLQVGIVTLHGVQHIKLSTPSITLDELCKIVNLPPTNDTNTYPDIRTVTSPEWASWPNYN